MNILYSLNKLLGRVGLLSLAGAVALIIAHPCVLTCAAAAPVITCEAPSWLKRSVSGSMNAVWRELDATQLSDAAARDTLALIASRLYPGFIVSVSDSGGIIMKPEREWRWRVVVNSPEKTFRMPRPLSEWINQDISDAKPAICSALENVPPAALEWASDSFQTHLKSIMKQYVPGWKCSVRARAADGDGTLEISLYPAEPVLIAVTPLTVSNTIPQIIADNITKKTLSYLSPLIGMPLPWIRRHEKKVVAWLGDKQLSDGWLQELHASATNTFSIKPLARVQTNIESTTFSLRGWISAHAGGAGARLQAGIHFGRLFTLGSSVPSEVYAEGILGLENWDFSGRFGLRFTPARSVWLGAEVTSGEDSTLWYRLWIHGPGIGPYTWLRYSEDDDIEAALGYRMNRFISMELHYDSRQDDRISLRAVSDM